MGDPRLETEEQRATRIERRKLADRGRDVLENVRHEMDSANWKLAADLDELGRVLRDLEAL